MSIQSKDVIKFAEAIDRELRKEANRDWQGKDNWWYLGQLVKEVRLMDETLTAKNKADVYNKAINIAMNAMIIACNQKKK